MISEPLGNLEEAIKSLDEPQEVGSRALTKTEKFIVLDYLVGSFYGVSIEDLSLKTKIGKLSYYIAEDLAPRLQSWYYSKISQVYPNYVPLLFQYRQLGQTHFCIQTDIGDPFLDGITAMYLSER